MRGGKTLQEEGALHIPNICTLRKFNQIAKTINEYGNCSNYVRPPNAFALIKSKRIFQNLCKFQIAPPVTLNNGTVLKFTY